MKKLLGILGLSTLLVLTGCGTTEWGNQNADQYDIVQNLVDTHAGKKMVYIDLGQPFDVIKNNNGKETKWVYYRAQGAINASSFIPIVGLFSAANLKGERREIVFDENGKVQSTTNKPFDKNLGVFSPGADEKAVEDARINRVKAEMDALKLPFDEVKIKKLTGIEKMTK